MLVVLNLRFVSYCCSSAILFISTVIESFGLHSNFEKNKIFYYSHEEKKEESREILRANNQRNVESTCLKNALSCLGFFARSRLPESTPINRRTPVQNYGSNS